MAGMDDRQPGNYRLVQLLGQADGADIYLGRHIHLNMRAVIKIQRARLEGEELEIFRAEMRARARLSHPHLLRLLDFGVDGGLPYLIAPYAPGGTVRQRHPYGSRVPLDQVVAYIRQVASALQYMHRCASVHGNVRPESMLIGEQDQLLLDIFDLYTSVHFSFEGSEATPRSGSRTIDICYQSPEQPGGSAMPASDQYALAVVAYEWLTGEVPCCGSDREVLVPLRKKLPSLPLGVEQVIFKALAREPGARFASVELFAAALARAGGLEASLPVPISFVPPPNARKSLLPTLNGPTGRAVLDAPLVTLGRARNNVLVLSDLKISAYHAEIRAYEDACRLVDLESLNGTFANEQRLQPGEEYRLQPGDILRLGKTCLIFELVESEQREQGEAVPETVKLPVPGLHVPLKEMPIMPSPESPKMRRGWPLEQGSVTRSMTTEIQEHPMIVSGVPGPAISPSLRISPVPVPTAKKMPVQSARPRDLMHAFVLIGLVFVILAASLDGLLFIQHNQVLQQQAQVTATAQTVSQATARAQATASALVTSPYPLFTHLALFDPLTNPNGSNVIWGAGVFSNCLFTAQGYLVSMAEQSRSVYCMAEGSDFGNFAYQVTMTILQGDCGGLAFRSSSASDEDEYLICADGQIQAYMSVNNLAVRANSLGIEKQRFSTAIHRGVGQPNVVAIVARNTIIQLYVNGHLIGTLNDTLMTHGRIGVFVPHFGKATSIRYTNALVWTAAS